MLRIFNRALLCVFLFGSFLPLSASAAIITPGQSVPKTSAEVFPTAASTFATWQSFVPISNGIQLPGIPAGFSVDSQSSFADGGTPTELVFNNPASLVSNNAYAFNFATPMISPQPDFYLDATSNVRTPAPLGFTRVVAQWQTRGAELDYGSFLLNSSSFAEPLAPYINLETNRSTLEQMGNAGGEFVNRIAIWDFATTEDLFELNFSSQVNHVSLDEFRVDTFTQATPFTIVTAVPEPTSFATLAFLTGSLLGLRRRKTMRV